VLYGGDIETTNGAMVMILTWKKQEDAIFGNIMWLRGLKEGESATAYRRGSYRYHAHAFIGGRYMSHCARTVQSAMKRLEAEIDRRSIGLFGVDDVTFNRDERS
jgi:hypothetical protein